jgi:orotidine-5'-phosphate decarboxylase
MNRKELVELIRKKASFLCVGLDSDSKKIPSILASEKDPVFAFNKAIIDATRDYCVSYKINTAFYEAMGSKGWETMEKTADYIGSSHFLIADAKRGDIGNTCDQYAKAFFESMNFNAITVAPYMGEDSVRPFLQHAGKWAIVLGLTSNKGAADFQLIRTFAKGFPHLSDDGEGYPSNLNPLEYFYEYVIRRVSQWGTSENLMFVAGATAPAFFENIRQIIPDHFLLVPGVGTQGGDLKAVAEKAMTKDIGILVNVSRSIIYASNEKDFAEAAGMQAKTYQEEMLGCLREG